MAYISIYAGRIAVLAPIPRVNFYFCGFFFDSLLLSVWMVSTFSIIDWVVGLHSILVLQLAPWLNRVKDLIDSFHELSLTHIYREQNVQADALSKLALQEEVGFNFFERWSIVDLVTAKDRMDFFD